MIQAPDPDTVEETFEIVFRSLNFPYLTADLDRLLGELESHAPEEGSWCEISLEGWSGEKRAAVVGAWRGLLSRVEITDGAIIALISSPTITARFSASEALARIANPDDAFFAIYTKGEKLVWEERTVWPAAYSTFVRQLDLLIRAFEAVFTERSRVTREQSQAAGISAENTVLVDQYTRVLPTAIHFAAASLGAWLGGAKNVHFFAHYACDPQLRDPDYAHRMAREMNYPPADARLLREGGIAAVPPSVGLHLIRAQGVSEVFGGIGLNEWNSANPPDAEEWKRGEDGQQSRAGILLDKYYRGGFLGRKLTPVAAYGARSVLRDHYDDFYASRRRDALVRCKHYCVPVYEVESLEEARSLVEQIPMRGPGNGLFFRGQTSLYTLDRPAKIKRFLFGKSCSTEPSLLSAASRHRFDYDGVHFALRHYLEHYALRRTMSEDGLRHEKWREMLCRPDLKIDYALMALAQHYGLPTHGLDVTTDIEVAAWFATNRYSADNGLARYEAMSVRHWARDSSRWPVVFVGQVVTQSLKSSLHDCLELEEFGLSALRPHRQRARFFLGGHSEHQNRMAEALVCILRLRPGDYRTSMNFEELFPGPDEDPAYRALLDFSEHPIFAALADGRVNRFHP